MRTSELARAETVRQRVVAAVRAAVPHVERVLVQLEAPTSPHVRYALPLADLQGSMSLRFGQAPYFGLVTVRREDRAVTEARIVANPHREEERGRGIRVAEWLLAQGVDVVLVREDLQGHAPLYVLRDAGVEVQRTEKAVLADALASLPNGMMERPPSAPG